MNLSKKLREEKGYILVIVTLIGIVLAFIFGEILPQLHVGQQVRAIQNLNEHRAFLAAEKGVHAVRLGLKGLTSLPDLINNTGQVETITMGIRAVCGTNPIAPDNDTNHFVYRDSDGNPQYISGCQGIDTQTADYPYDKGMLQVVVLVGDNNGNLVIHYYDSREKSTYDTDSPWVTEANPSPIAWAQYFYKLGVDEIGYVDFDGQGSGNYDTEADVKFRYYYNDDPLILACVWDISIGNDGSFRKQSNGGELWNFGINYNALGTSKRRPFYGKENNEEAPTDTGNCLDDTGDCVEVFIIVRSTGITVAPGSTYDPVTNMSDLELINNSTNGSLPNPMRQCIEAGFYLIEVDVDPDPLVEDWVLKTQRFYYSKVHNLK